MSLGTVDGVDVWRLCDGHQTLYVAVKSAVFIVTTVVGDPCT